MLSAFRGNADVRAVNALPGCFSSAQRVKEAIEKGGAGEGLDEGLGQRPVLHPNEDNVNFQDNELAIDRWLLVRGAAGQGKRRQNRADRRPCCGLSKPAGNESGLRRRSRTCGDSEGVLKNGDLRHVDRLQGHRRHAYAQLRRKGHACMLEMGLRPVRARMQVGVRRGSAVTVYPSCKRASGLARPGHHGAAELLKLSPLCA